MEADKSSILPRKLLRTISAGLIALAIGSAGIASAAPAPLYIGFVGALSGGGAYLGIPHKKAIELAVKDLNAKGGVDGHAVKVSFEDSTCTPVGAAQAARKLIGEGVNVLIGDDCSSATLGMMPVIARAKMPTVNISSSALAITNPGDPWMFRLMPNEVMQMASLAKIATGQLHAKTAVILHETTDSGNGNAKEFKQFFEQHGGKVLASIGFDRQLQDFTPIATRIKSLGKIDVIPTFLLEGQGWKVIQALAQAGITEGGGGHSVQMTSLWIPPREYFKEAGRAAKGYVLMVEFYPDSNSPQAKSFVAEFEKAYHEKPSYLNARAYDAITVITKAVQLGGGTSNVQIQKGIRDISGLEVLTGTVTFKEDNSPACMCSNKQQNIEPDVMKYVVATSDGSYKPLDQ